jgi:hypothetical protein
MIIGMLPHRSALGLNPPNPGKSQMIWRMHPFHVLFQVRERETPLAVPKTRRLGLSSPLSGREQNGAGDGRSVFHSRVGYRMNACRRGITSVLARASAMPAPRGARGLP